MRAIVVKINPRRQSKYGGYYQRVIFKSLEDSKNYILDVYENNNNSSRFLPYIKPQAMFDKLNIYKDKFINGNSNFYYLGIKKQENERNN